MNNKLVILFTLFVNSIGFAQTFTGTILDADTNYPLPNVSVYFDGTTIGVITDLEGVFSITSKQNMTVPLVVSSIGYESQIIDKLILQTSPIIKLKPEANNLEEVIVSDDDWSRAKKMGYFKREFIGHSIYSKDCKITNLDKVKLKYSKVDQTMYAMADQPIIIINKYLGYKVEYNLVDFEIVFKTPPSGLNTVSKVLYSGTSVFSELSKKKIKKRYIQNRSFVYKTSLLYFMRSLAKNTLRQNGFRLFKRESADDSDPLFETTQKSVFRTVKRKNNLTEVAFFDSKKVVVSFDNLDQAFLLPNAENRLFYIDDFGIHSPVNSLLFGGVFGSNRMVSMLPINYNLD
ncbi:carboxypeptidase-like regulatory domain-containing protein [Olleya sp. HaHaR_3_96]|uniref:carboxypeptidase-like regulatory domain-containing protein n=1 Tax=Olleya sp. HaHaR_3_96 TaxID=2745560 RepID=UPI001C4EA6AB|nr:carboxypeptidase-like regulatory domain-containing protein [Olleya sp. HaHaR_3_96]QXP60972.1 carboxypeptidase-like regulatory domain-containing protein [Olleya sp. HaHaR_3_96]